MNTEALRERLTKHNPSELKKYARALVIGLGGSGSTYVSETKDLFVKRYGTKDVAEMMDFLCIDTTDAGRPSNLKDKEWLKISSLNKNNPWIKGWLNPDIHKLDLDPNGDGAGGVRMVGRWKLFSTEIDIIGRLNGIIENYAKKLLKKGGDGIRKVYVVVVSGIFGGTGCGTFIDVPYFVRKSIEVTAEAHKNLFEFYGILELPDSKKIGSIPEKTKGRANTYAAMKDLYYFMDKMGHQEKTKDSLYTAQFEDKPDCLFESGDRIFDQCFLVSNNNGDNVDRNVYDENGEPRIVYLNMAIPEAINAMMSDPKIPLDSEGKPLDEKKHFDFDQAMNNIKTGGFPRNKRNDNMRFFATIGVDKIEIPMTKIIEAIFARLFSTLDYQWKLIQDKKLIISIINGQVAPCFQIETDYAEMTGAVDCEAEAMVDANVLQNDFFKTFWGSIDYDEDKRKDKIQKKLKKTVDAIYQKYGPFVALKVFETTQQGNMLLLNLVIRLEQIKKQADIAMKAYFEKYPTDINIVINNVEAVTNKRKKTDAEKKLVPQKKLFACVQAKMHIYKKIEEWTMEIYKNIQKLHYAQFVKTTTMLNAMNTVFFEATGIKTTADEWNQNGTQVYSWNSSAVSHREIDKKIRFLFWKKISFNDGREKVYTQDKIYLVLPDGTERELSPGGFVEGMKIKIRKNGNDDDKVSSIEEVIRFVPGVDKEIPVEEMIQAFLQRIKTIEINKELLSGSDDSKKQAECNKQIADIVFPFIVQSMEGIIKEFAEGAFEDKVIYGTAKASLDRDYAQAEKDELFGTAVEAFNQRMEPSFPVIGDDTLKATLEKNFSELFIPEGMSKHYRDIIDDTPSRISVNIEKVNIKSTSMMIGVNFYFGLDLSSYFFMRDCKEAYDDIVRKYKEKGDVGGIGLHIAEGPKEDIRPLLRTLEPLG